jgi:hypothetical protein
MKKLITLLGMVLASKICFASADRLDKNQLNDYKSCLQKIGWVYNQQTACLSYAVKHIDLDLFIAIEKRASASGALEMTERVDLENINKSVLMRLLNEPLLSGPTGYTLYDVAKLITIGQLNEDCYTLREQTLGNDRAIQFCRSINNRQPSSDTLQINESKAENLFRTMLTTNDRVVDNCTAHTCVVQAKCSYDQNSEHKYVCVFAP